MKFLLTWYFQVHLTQLPFTTHLQGAEAAGTDPWLLRLLVWASGEDQCRARATAGGWHGPAPVSCHGCPHEAFLRWGSPTCHVYAWWPSRHRWAHPARPWWPWLHHLRPILHHPQEVRLLFGCLCVWSKAVAELGCESIYHYCHQNNRCWRKIKIVFLSALMDLWVKTPYCFSVCVRY